MASQGIRIGLVTTLVGPYAEAGKDTVRGAKLAIGEMSGEVAGKPLDLVVESSNNIPASAVEAVQELLERDAADFVVGPLSGNEGLAVRDYARKHPDKVFMNGSSASQEMVLRNPAPNFFNFASHGAQWVSGLADYAYNTLGYRRVATLGVDYSFCHTQVGAFTLEFTRLGGEIAGKYWTFLSQTDFSGILGADLEGVDAIYVTQGGSDAISFYRQYQEAGLSIPLLGGTLPVNQTVLSTQSGLAESLSGTVASGPIADDNPDPHYQAFARSYKAMFDDGMAYPSLLALNYYLNTRASLLALEQIDGDASNTEAFVEALSALSFDSPAGHVRLDDKRRAILNNYVTVVDRDADGVLYNRLVETIEEVSPTLGLPEDEYLAIGPFTRDNPPLQPA